MQTLLPRDIPSHADNRDRVPHARMASRCRLPIRDAQNLWRQAGRIVLPILWLFRQIGVADTWRAAHEPGAIGFRLHRWPAPPCRADDRWLKERERAIPLLPAQCQLLFLLHPLR